jgi:hypothetical protein
MSASKKPAPMSGRTVGRVLDALGHVEGHDAGRYNGGVPPGWRDQRGDRHVFPIRVTGSPDEDTPNLWPARVRYWSGYAADTHSFADADAFTACWVFPAPGGDGLANTGEYLALFVGVHSDGKAVYEAVSAGGGTSLDTRNSDNSDLIAATTRITASLADGAEFEAAGTQTLFKPRDAGPAQKGMVTTANQGVGGRKWSGVLTTTDPLVGVGSRGWWAYQAGPTLDPTGNYDSPVTVAVSGLDPGEAILSGPFFAPFGAVCAPSSSDPFGAESGVSAWCIGSSNFRYANGYGGANGTTPVVEFCTIAAPASDFESPEQSSALNQPDTTLSLWRRRVYAGSVTREPYLSLFDPSPGFGVVRNVPNPDSPGNWVRKLFDGTDEVTSGLSGLWVPEEVRGGLVISFRQVTLPPPPPPPPPPPTFSFDSVTGVLSWSIGGHSGAVTLCACDGSGGGGGGGGSTTMAGSFAAFDLPGDLLGDIITAVP